LCSPARSAQKSGGLRHVVKDNELRICAGRNGISSPLIVAEFHQRRSPVKDLDDRTDLSARELVCRPILEKGNDIKKRGPTVPGIFVLNHHNTQHVTKRGLLSFIRTIQNVLTTLFL